MATPLKDQYLTPDSLGELCDLFEDTLVNFDRKAFLSSVYSDMWNEFELMDRMRHVSKTFQEILPTNYSEAIRVLRSIAPRTKGMEAFCFPQYVAFFGLNDVDISLEALAFFTRYSSSEFAIRPFILKDEKKVMKYLHNLSGDENEHVRRFSSEGCRPRLPWATPLASLKRDPNPIFRILHNLMEDNSEYVRRSVANNLNDISKDNPDLVIDFVKQWKGKSTNSDRIIKHALRTLLKAAHPEALKLFGYGHPENIIIEGLKILTNPLMLGEDTLFTFRLINQSDTAEKLRLEYAIDYVKANGKTSRKIFQLSEKEYFSGLHIIKRKISFKKLTTRKFYPGEHRLAIIVNGVEKMIIKFDVV